MKYILNQRWGLGWRTWEPKQGKSSFLWGFLLSSCAEVWKEYVLFKVSFGNPMDCCLPTSIGPYTFPLRHILPWNNQTPKETNPSIQPNSYPNVFEIFTKTRLVAYIQPSSLLAFSVDAYTAVASPGLLGHSFIGIFCTIRTTKQKIMDKSAIKLLKKRAEREDEHTHTYKPCPRPSQMLQPFLTRMCPVQSPNCRQCTLQHKM